MKLLIFFLLILLVLPAFPQILSVEISGIRCDKGVIQLSLYRDKETFAEETPFKIYNFDKTSMIDGKINITIPDLTTGTYAIALIDDKNENGKIDYRLFIPCEGFGFSNYHFKGTRKPNFEAFSFSFSEENTTINIQVQYF
jgi:uncharacterized protein (DUF2141 family)